MRLADSIFALMVDDSTSVSNEVPCKCKDITTFLVLLCEINFHIVTIMTALTREMLSNNFHGVKGLRESERVSFHHIQQSLLSHLHTDPTPHTQAYTHSHQVWVYIKHVYATRWYVTFTMLCRCTVYSTSDFMFLTTPASFLLFLVNTEIIPFSKFTSFSITHWNESLR